MFGRFVVSTAHIICRVGINCLDSDNYWICGAGEANEECISTFQVCEGRQDCQVCKILS